MEGGSLLFIFLFVCLIDFFCLFVCRPSGADVESPKDEDEPGHLAEVVFRDLVCRASYGNIRSVIVPVLV